MFLVNDMWCELNKLILFGIVVCWFYFFFCVDCMVGFVDV